MISVCSAPIIYDAYNHRLMKTQHSYATIICSSFYPRSTNGTGREKILFRFDSFTFGVRFEERYEFEHHSKRIVI